MKTNLNELLAALPKDDDVSDANDVEITQEQLHAIFADLSLRPVPTGSLHRMWTLGELSTQVALAYTALWIRGWFANAEKKKQQKMETNLRVALKMVHRLGYLRGALAKVGQLMGSLPEILPEQVVSTMEKLHFEAPPMHFSLLREMVRNELGKDPEDLFASFEHQAFAAASLGQVHRATLKTGEQVAVKIQYPGIARTIDSDMRNLNAMLFPHRLGRDWKYMKANFEDIQEHMKAEIDYQHEAENLRKAAALFKPEEGIVIPRLYDEYSSKRILTMDFIPGLHLEAFLATKPSQAVRDDMGTKMFTARYRLYYAFMNHADPHSGNYLFMRDGRLALLDFGCVQNYNEEERELVRLGEHLVNREFERMPEFLRRVGAPERHIANPEFMKRNQAFTDWAVESVNNNEPFDFGDGGRLSRGAELFTDMVLKRENQCHPMYAYFFRSLFGVEAMLYRLGARVNVRAIHDREVQALN